MFMFCYLPRMVVFMFSSSSLGMVTFIFFFAMDDCVHVFFARNVCVHVFFFAKNVCVHFIFFARNGCVMFSLLEMIVFIFSSFL